MVIKQIIQGMLDNITQSRYLPSQYMTFSGYVSFGFGPSYVKNFDSLALATAVSPSDIVTAVDMDKCLSMMAVHTTGISSVDASSFHIGIVYTVPTRTVYVLNQY